MKGLNLAPPLFEDLTPSERLLLLEVFLTLEEDPDLRIIEVAVIDEVGWGHVLSCTWLSYNITPRLL